MTYSLYQSDRHSMEVFQAVKEDDIETIKLEIKCGLSLTDPDEAPRLLASAAWHDSLKTTQYLAGLLEQPHIDKAFADNAALQNPGSNTFWFLANHCKHDCLDSRALLHVLQRGGPETVKKLLKESNTQVVVAELIRQGTPELQARFEKIIQEEIDAGNKALSYKEQVIRQIIDNDINGIQTRLDNGEDLSFDNQQPFRYAVHLQRNNIVSAFIDKATVTTSDMEAAIATQNTELVRILLKKFEFSENSWKIPFDAAVRGGQEILELVIPLTTPHTRQSALTHLKEMGQISAAEKLESLIHAHQLKQKHGISNASKRTENGL